METENEIKNLKIEVADINRTLNAILKAIGTLQDGEIDRLKEQKLYSLKQQTADKIKR